jgi:hypothetical protein
MYEKINEMAFYTSEKTGEVEVSCIPERAFLPNEKIDA